MAFGQAAGPPAGARQLEQLAALLERTGFSSFREARHPYGLSQRQAAGRFTVTEADELIERLEAAEAVQQGVAAPGPSSEPAVASRARQASPRRARTAQRTAEALSAVDAGLLVTELERRGWCCIPPVSELEQDQA